MTSVYLETAKALRLDIEARGADAEAMCRVPEELVAVLGKKGPVPGPLPLAPSI